MFTKKIALITAVTLLLLSFYSVNKIKQASDATIFTYPLVLMDLTRQAQLSQRSTANGENGQNGKHLYKTNHFTHIQIFPDHNFRNVVRPNNDTLYSIAWLDLSDEPIVLSVPDMSNRYYVMPLMDAWTNTNPVIGKRLSGTQAGDFLITGPHWNAKVPSGIKHVAANTNMTWIIGRIQTNGRSDIPSVAKLQNQFTLTPLSRWGSDKANPNLIIDSKTSNESLEPMAQIEAMSATTFFNLAAELIESQPAATDDAQALKNLDNLGVLSSSKRFNLLDRWLVNFAVNLTLSKIKQGIDNRPANENGWKIIRDVIGDYGTHYKLRTGVAMFGLGAVTPPEASYPHTALDSNGQKLSGEHQYRLRFAAGETPPVNAFWSLSMYDTHGFFIENSINRYAIGDRDALTFNADGSLDLVIQHPKPAELESNWLPAPKGEFELTLRVYHAKPRFLNDSWTLPAVERIN